VLPHIPAVGEFVPGYEASTCFGIGAPRNTLAEIIDTLNREIDAGLADPNIRTRLTDLGGMVLGGSPADLRRLTAEETEKWSKVIKVSSAKLD
jgi:tripartite-type tricarboxylate transporter receptor subunit TctC